MKTESSPDTIPAMFCEHANEVPQACPCPPNCYCRWEGSCKVKPLSALKTESFDWCLKNPVFPNGMMEPFRPDWDFVWNSLALNLSARSTCDRLKVGCAIVSQDNQRVLAVGYNGGPRGISNECLSADPGQCGHLHAEVNALIKADYHDLAGKKMYVTTQPCYTCAVAIVNACIAEVIYLNPYRTRDGLDLLLRAGIKTRQLYT